MKKKALITCHVGRHFRIFGHYDYQVLLEMGYEVHIAANFCLDIDKFEDERVIKHQIDFQRNPFSFGNLKAYKQMQQLFEREHFDLIQTQSPTGGVITRLAANKTRKKGSKVIYTAHGFHFFKGASIINWILYYGIEKMLTGYTDCIITINDEDYSNAINRLKFKNVKKIHGVGIDLDKFKPQTIDEKNRLRKEYGYKDDDIIIIYAGELSYRKNQDMVIEAAHYLDGETTNLKILLAGTGKLINKYKKQVTKYKLDNIVQILGYRKDIKNLMMISDVGISTSRQEGLPVNIMEAMATGLPIVVTDCRGNSDLVRNGENGYIVQKSNLMELVKAIREVYNSKMKRIEFGNKSLEIINDYSFERVKKEMIEIYSLI